MNDAGSFAFSLFVAYPLSAFLHEVGHVLAARAGGEVATSFGLGLGRPWLVRSVRGVKVYLGLSHPMQGVMFAYGPRQHTPRWSTVLMLAGGLLANASLMGLFLALWRWMPWGGECWLVIAGTNALFFIGSLIPYEWRVGKTRLCSDGAQMIRALFRRGDAAALPKCIECCNALRGLWTAIGDTPILRVYLVHSAIAWIELGDADHAEAILDEEEAFPGPRPPHLPAIASLLRGQIAEARGLPDAADRAADAAECDYRATDQPDGLAVVDLVRTIAHAQRGDAAAIERLAVLDRGPDLRWRPELGLALLTAQLALACSRSDLPSVERWISTYEPLRRRHPSPTRDIRVYGLLALARARQDDLDGAEAAYRRVLSAIREISDAWIDPAHRDRFIKAQSDLIGRARLVFESRGKGPEFEGLIASNSAPSTERADERAARLRRLGLRGLLANIGVVVTSLAVYFAIEGLVARFGILVAIAFGVFVAFHLAYLLFDQTVGRLSPVLKRAGGAVLLVLALLPWIASLMVVVMLIVDPRR